MAILTLFGQQHQLKDKETPSEQQELLNIIERAQTLARDIPELLPKERSYVVLLLKILTQQQEQQARHSHLTATDTARLENLCAKMETQLQEARMTLDQAAVTCVKIDYRSQEIETNSSS